MISCLGIDAKLHPQLLNLKHEPSHALTHLDLHGVESLLELLRLQAKHQLHLAAEAIPAATSTI